MAETHNSEEPTFNMKRKPDLNWEDSEERSKKAQKLETVDNNSLASADKSEESEATSKSQKNLEVPNSNCSSVTEEKIEKIDSEVVAKEDGNEDAGDDNEVDNDEEDGNGDDDEDEETGVDRKGKGKLIEEESEGEDESSDNDSSEDGVVSDGDSDLSDDPLAEVDLNNILPSRTRRRTINPGTYIANDLPNDEDEDGDDSDT